MNEATHVSVYRTTLDAAYADLDQVLEMLAQLRARKEQVEGAVNSLRPIVEELKPVELHAPAISYEMRAETISTEVKAQPVAQEAHAWQIPAESNTSQIRSTSENTGDKFKNHINQVLGMLATA